MVHHIYAILHLLIESLAARRDAQIRFLQEENRILRSRISRQRLILTPEERGRLLQIGKELNHAVKGVVSVVEYQTYCRWVKEQQAGLEAGRVGRPRTIKMDLRKLILRMAKENPGWGYFRIVGELMKLRVKIGKTSVRRILREGGFYPQPNSRRPYDGPNAISWDQFMKLHVNTLVACDFFCKTIWTPFGKQQAYLMMFIHVATRKVWVSPATYNPDEQWVNQQGRNLLMWLEDNGLQATHLLRDRDAKFTPRFDALMKSDNLKIVRSPIQAPNANSYAEAWIASAKRECLNYFCCFSLRHLEHITNEYVHFYNEHRPHQRMGNQTLKFSGHAEPDDGREMRPIKQVHCKSSLGGLLKRYCHRSAA